jgi:hypothetical protein
LDQPLEVGLGTGLGFVGVGLPFGLHGSLLNFQGASDANIDDIQASGLDELKPGQSGMFFDKIVGKSEMTDSVLSE